MLSLVQVMRDFSICSSRQTSWILLSMWSRERECGKSLRRLDSLARFANLCWGEWDGAEGAPQFICNRNMYLVSLVCFIMELLFSDLTKDLNRIASKEGA